MRQYQRQYNENNKEAIKQYMRDNKEASRQYQKKYYENNKEIIKQHMKDYRLKKKHESK